MTPLGVGPKGRGGDIPPEGVGPKARGGTPLWGVGPKARGGEHRLSHEYYPVGPPGPTGRPDGGRLRSWVKRSCRRPSEQSPRRRVCQEGRWGWGLGDRPKGGKRRVQESQAKPPDARRARRRVAVTCRTRCPLGGQAKAKPKLGGVEEGEARPRREGDELVYGARSAIKRDKNRLIYVKTRKNICIYAE